MQAGSRKTERHLSFLYSTILHRCRVSCAIGVDTARFIRDRTCRVVSSREAGLTFLGLCYMKAFLYKSVTMKAFLSKSVTSCLSLPHVFQRMLNPSVGH
jgi:hypothetical protein